ncbi:MAG TPA: recombinase family protein [Myxococcales bacterium]|nr:recombinase family protein [Myxococcales bacterium]
MSDHAKPPRFVELIRVSTSGQHDRDTPENQRRALDRLRAARPGVLVERIESPSGISGALGVADRPDLQRLAKLVQARSFDELRVYDVDRLTRAEDPRERFAIYGMIQDAGAVIVDTSGRETNPGDASGLGEIDFYLRTFFASQERKRILRRTIDGKSRCAKAGLWTGFGLPYGIDWDATAKKFIVDPKLAKVIHRVFAEADAGRPVRKIAKGLNADGIASCTGGRWGSAGTLRVLHQQSYLTGQLAVRVAGERVVHENAFTPVITRDLWDRVRASLVSRRCRPGVRWTTKEALLRGLAICGRCGASIHVQSDGNGHNKGRRYYRCSTRHASSGRESCGASYHRLERTDEAVWSALSKALADSSWLTKAATPPPPGTSSWETQAERCKKQLKELEHHEIQTARNHRRGLLSDTAYAAALREIRSDRDTCERTLKVAEDAISTAALATGALNSLKARIATLRGSLDTCDFAARRRIVEALVPHGDGFGFFLHDGGRVEMHGVLDVAGEGTGKLFKGTGKLFRGSPTPARPYRAARPADPPASPRACARR